MATAKKFFFSSSFWFYLAMFVIFNLVFFIILQIFCSTRFKMKLFGYLFAWIFLVFRFFFSFYSRHPLSRTPKGAAKKLQIVNVRDSEKEKKIGILHTRNYINLTCNTSRGKTETKAILLGKISKIASSPKIKPCKIKEFCCWVQPRKLPIK